MAVITCSPVSHVRLGRTRTVQRLAYSGDLARTRRDGALHVISTVRVAAQCHHIVELCGVGAERLAAVIEEGKHHASAGEVARGWATGAAVLAGLVAAFDVHRLGAGLQVWARIYIGAVLAGESLQTQTDLALYRSL